MSQPQMNFGGDAVAKAYDKYLVPTLFDPWAEMLLDHMRPGEGDTVLDLATGTGVVALKLAERVGASGKVVCADLNPEMMRLAKERCQGASCAVEFVEGSAESLDIESDSVDLAYCQQGFQFFPDREAAAKEIQRLLKRGGRVSLTTWLPVARCHYFGEIHEALHEIGEADIAAVMATPFDFMPEEELTQPFVRAGFTQLDVTRQSRSMGIEGGIEKAVETIYGTPIAPKLRALPQTKQDQFREVMTRRLEHLRGCDGVTYGSLAANVLTATA